MTRARHTILKIKRTLFRKNRNLFLSGAFCAVIFIMGCSPENENEYAPEFSSVPNISKPTYIFGVHPLHNPQRLNEVYGPIVDYINSKLRGGKIVLEASRSYDEYNKKLYDRRFHFALPNPYQTINAFSHGYRVFGKLGDDENFRGIIIVRKDGKINGVEDLKGKSVSFPANTALAATMMPLYYLHTHGIDVNTDIQRLYTGSQESSIMSVYQKNSVAGATWPLPWITFQEKYPEIAVDLTVKWETPSLVNNSLVVRDDIPIHITEEVAAILFSLHGDAKGKELLKAVPVSKFEAATNSTYDMVRDFMRSYNQLAIDEKR